MKKSIFAAVALCGLFLAGCGGNNASKENANDVEAALTVDDILDNPEQYVGKTVVIEGECSHLCKYGGKKAFLASAKSDKTLRADANGKEFKAFPKETIHQVLRVTGTVMETRIDEAAVEKMEADYNKAVEVHGENVEVGCDAEKQAQGQAELNTYAARMQDYRNKIAERLAKEGKAYVSQYYLVADGYEIVKDEEK